MGQAADAGEAAGGLVGEGDAQVLPIAVLNGIRSEGADGPVALPQPLQGGEEPQQLFDGVVPGLGAGGVGGAPGGGDDEPFRALGHGDAGGLLRGGLHLRQKGGLRGKHRLGGIRHHIAGYPAGKLLHPAPGGLAHRLEGIDALFPVADGEVGIRHDGEVRHGLLLHKVLNILHPRLLAAPEEEGELAAQGEAQLPESLHHVHGDHGGVFIVGDPAADEQTVLLDGVEGVVGPVVPHRHHVQVREEADGLVPLPALGQAVPVAAVLGGKTVALGQLQGLIQHLGAALAKGHPVRPKMADAGDAHQRLQVLHHPLAALEGVFLNACLQFLRDHNSSSSFRLSRKFLPLQFTMNGGRNQGGQRLFPIWRIFPSVHNFSIVFPAQMGIIEKQSKCIPRR